MYHADAHRKRIMRRIDGNFFSVKKYLTFVRIVKTGQHVHERRLAASILSEKCENFTVLDVQAAVIVSGDAAEPLGDAAHGYSGNLWMI